MFRKPNLFDFGNSCVVFLTSALGSPGDNGEPIALLLECVQLTSQSGEVQQRSCDFVGSGIFGFQIGEPVLDTVEVSDCAVHVEVDCDSHLIQFLSFFVP